MYAQILKETMIVNLIGGKEVGLPLEHPMVICIDISEHPQRNELKVGMSYDVNTDIFCDAPLKKNDEAAPETKEEPQPTQEDMLMELLTQTTYTNCLLELGM